MISIDDLSNGESAEITGFHKQNDQIAELQALGLVPGTRLTVVRRAPLGDPVQVSVRGFNLGISRSIAKLLILSTV